MGRGSRKFFKIMQVKLLCMKRDEKAIMCHLNDVH
jgi:hypothetical protein